MNLNLDQILPYRDNNTISIDDGESPSETPDESMLINQTDMTLRSVKATTELASNTSQRMKLLRHANF